jgi:hypothetical protein
MKITLSDYQSALHEKIMLNVKKKHGTLQGGSLVWFVEEGWRFRAFLRKAWARLSVFWLRNQFFTKFLMSTEVSVHVARGL